MAKRGFDAKLSIGVTPTELGKARDVELRSTATDIDTSTRDGAGWSDSEQGLKSWEISGEALHISDNTALELLEAAYLNGTAIDVELLDGTGGHGYEGSGVVLELGRSEPLDGALTVPFKIKGKGALVKVDPS